MLFNAVKHVIDDKGFDVPTENSQRARLIAHKMLEIIENDQESECVLDFASWLVQEISACCTYPRGLTCHALKEHIWQAFYKLSSGNCFRTRWTTFIESKTGLKASAIFYQFVTRSIFDELIKAQFPILPGGLAPGVNQPSLNHEESSALRYCGGYVVRSLIKKVGISSRDSKEDLIICLKDLCEGKYTPLLCLCNYSILLDDDDEVSVKDSTEWLNSVDRGGLLKISDIFYEFLVAVEVEVRRHFPAVLTDAYDNEDLKTAAICSTMSSENVHFYWEIITTDWCGTIGSDLFKLIVEHYVTIRGFSFTKGFMEKYKQSRKKTTQKSKGLRKNVYCSSSTHN